MNLFKETIKKFFIKCRENFPKAGLLKKFILGIDYLFSLLIYGASVSDYFLYEFYKKRHAEKKTYFVFRHLVKLQKVYNKKSDRLIFRDKRKFYQVFKNYIKRDWLDLNTCEFEEFINFIHKNQEFIVKPFDGGGGKDILKYKLSENEDYRELFEQLKEKKAIVEEVIKQKGALADFNPSTVNSIRITSIKKPDPQKEIDTMSASVRFGCGNMVVDNMSSGGITANIDIETGVIDNKGVDIHGNSYIFHPTTNKQIVGFKIPYWKELKDFVKEISNIVPTIRYVGWDIVILDEGEFLVIEGNERGGHKIQQITLGKGIWPRYQKLIRS